MRILAFPGRFNTKAKAPVRDWSTQEIADFYRAHRLLAENGAGIGIDRGVSDEGEPWMVFFDTASHDVFLHIARIDGTCHLICEPFGMRLDAADITALIAQFEHAVRDHLAIRSEQRGKNVVVHPAARIIMSISAVFLLFKLENGEAYAKGLAEKTGALGATEKSAGPLARAQSAFQRAFDAAEAPVNAALLAGIILAGELALSPLRGTQSEAEMEKLVAMALVEHAPVLVRADGHGLDAVVAETLQHEPLSVALELPLAALVAPVPVVADLPVTVQFTPPETVVQVAAVGTLADFRAAQFQPVAVEAPGKAQTAEGRLVADQQSDAAKTLEFLFTASTGVFRPADPAPAEAPLPTAAKLGDVTLANVDALDGQLAFSARIDISIVELLSLFRYLDRHMPGYEFGFDGDKTLVEQSGLADLDMTKVASITGSLGDGSSSVIIVGRAEVLDGVLNLFG